MSSEKREKIESILNHIDYEPNIAASFLASGKSYRIVAITPTFSSDDYWELVSGGIDRAAKELRRFNVRVSHFRFDQYDRTSFTKAAAEIAGELFDGGSHRDPFRRTRPKSLRTARRPRYSLHLYRRRHSRHTKSRLFRR